MDALTYRGGPPPAEGWWPVLPLDAGSQEYRWWNGTHWSLPADADCDEGQASFLKCLPAGFTDDDIKWRGWTDDERAGKAPQPELPNADLF